MRGHWMVYVNINLFLIIRTFYVKVIKKMNWQNAIGKFWIAFSMHTMNFIYVQGYKAEGIYDNS